MIDVEKRLAKVKIRPGRTIPPPPKPVKLEDVPKRTNPLPVGLHGLKSKSYLKPSYRASLRVT